MRLVAYGAGALGVEDVAVDGWLEWPATPPSLGVVGCVFFRARVRAILRTRDERDA